MSSEPTYQTDAYARYPRFRHFSHIRYMCPSSVVCFGSHNGRTLALNVNMPPTTARFRNDRQLVTAPGGAILDHRGGDGCGQVRRTTMRIPDIRIDAGIYKCRPSAAPPRRSAIQAIGN